MIKRSSVAEAPRRTVSVGAWIGQAILYALFAVFIGVFSHWPTYRPLDPGQALIKVSFSHTGKPVGDCVRRSPEELAKLPPQMRKPIDCPRERSPVSIEVDIGGQNVLTRTARPTGLKRDGASAVYERLPVPAGEQRIAVRMKDDVRAPGFTHQREASVSLEPSQVLVIDFDAEKGGITLR